MSKELVNAIADMREEEALKLVKEMVEGGSEHMAILDAAREAMDIVGQRYEEGTYFLPELLLAGEMLSQITDIVKPALAKLPEISSPSCSTSTASMSSTWAWTSPPKSSWRPSGTFSPRWSA